MIQHGPPNQPVLQRHAMNAIVDAYLHSASLLQERALSTLDNRHRAAYEIVVVQWTVCIKWIRCNGAHP